jgi:hypothetical protein
MYNNFQQFELILKISQVSLFEIKGGQSNFIGLDDLELLLFHQKKLYIIKIGAFEYTLSNEIPVMYESRQNKKVYILPNAGGKHLYN